MDFFDIIYRNNNYVENLHVTGNEENKNIIFIQQFCAPKQYPKRRILIARNCHDYNSLTKRTRSNLTHCTCKIKRHILT